MKYLKLIILLLITIGSTLLAQAQPYNISTLTNTNRNYTNMFGGWGPHLRSIMRSHQEDQWMAIDNGADVYHNDRIQYYQLAANQTTWTSAGQSNIAPYEIQQNMAHVMVGNQLNSYGIELTGLDNGNVWTNRIVQVSRNTQTNTSTMGYLTVNGSINLPGNTANYVGAAVNPENGLEVVWWHLSSSTLPATFYLIWKYPAQTTWNGPIAMSEIVNGNAYNMFLYVYGTFVGDNRLELVGQSGIYNVSGISDFYIPAHQAIDFTPTAATPQGFTWLGNSATAANRVTDIWKNPCNNDLHVLGYSTSTGDAIYYYRPDGSSTWQDWQYKGRMTDRFDSKFSYDVHTDTLAIVNYGYYDLFVSKLRVSELTEDIDLNSLQVDTIPFADLNTDGCSALYVQRAAMQTNPITHQQMATVGKYPNYDNLIRYIKEDNIDLNITEVNACLPPCSRSSIEVFLQGPSLGVGLMSTVLYDAGLLPGQTPSNNQNTPTPAGHPYSGAPWNFAGTEGTNFTDATYQDIVTSNNGLKPVDWVLVAFRTGLSATTKVHRTAALLLENGAIHLLEDCLELADGGKYHLVIEHRNHLAVISSTRGTYTSGKIDYDFTQQDSYVSGGVGSVEISPGLWAMIQGDTDADGLIDASDRSLAWNNRNQTGYLREDSDLNGYCDAADRSMVWNNRNLNTQVP